MLLNNVVGTGVGRKISRDNKLPQWAVVVYVKKKVPESRLDKQDVIPVELHGVPPDVVEIGEPIAYEPNQTSLTTRPPKP